MGRTKMPRNYSKKNCGMLVNSNTNYIVLIIPCMYYCNPWWHVFYKYCNINQVLKIVVQEFVYVTIKNLRYNFTIHFWMGELLKMFYLYAMVRSPGWSFIFMTNSTKSLEGRFNVMYTSCYGQQQINIVCNSTQTKKYEQNLYTNSI